MKELKIYSRNNPKSSLYYYRELEDDDIISQDCYLKFGSAWTKVVEESVWQNQTLKSVKERRDNFKEIIIAKRFNNC